MTNGIILTTGKSGHSLYETVRDIIGEQENCVILGNFDDDCVRLQSDICRIIDRFKPEEDVVIFTDIRGGSCWNVVQRCLDNEKRVYLLSGVNLPMLLKFFTKCRMLSTPELLETVMEAGRMGIGCREVMQNV